MRTGLGYGSRKNVRAACLLLFSASCMALGAGEAQAQSNPPVVSACSGVRLPRSVVTDIMAPVIQGTATPLQSQFNDLIGILGSIPLIGPTTPPLNFDVTNLLNGAAGGAPITLQVYDENGNAVDPAGGCSLQADSITLANEGGVAIGGNQISGLGANGETAFAGDLDAVALGNNARAEPGATGSIAIGADSQVTAANSVAIGQGSTATRGAQLQYAALAIAGPVDSAGEFSVGAPGAERQITNVAPGSAPTDAVNVAQLQGVSSRVDAIETNVTNLTTRVDNLTTLVGSGGGAPGPVQYSDAAGTANGGTPSNDATLVGASAGPVVLHNVGDGQVAAGSTDAVNGGQLDATNQNVTNLQADVTNLTTQVTTNTLAITNLTTLIGTLTGGAVTPNPVQYSDAAGAPNGGTPSNDVTLVGGAAGPVVMHNVGDGQVAAGSTDGVNGGQLYAVQQGSVRYDGPAHDSVTFGDGASPVVLHNVAAGTAPTDAVNLGQLNAGMTSAVETAVGQANAYTDMRLAAIDFDLNIMRRDLNGGIAGALAAAGMPQASDPGRAMIAMGVSTYQGQQAVAFGFSARLRDARTVIRAGANFDTRGRASGNAGVGVQF